MGVVQYSNPQKIIQPEIMKQALYKLVIEMIIFL